MYGIAAPPLRYASPSLGIAALTGCIRGLIRSIDRSLLPMLNRKIARVPVKRVAIGRDISASLRCVARREETTWPGRMRPAPQGH
ncbi:hypothetical protein CHELA1G11_13270 [Hyphomicrobiales bacterium]|nr:hypothetical protein CHELA1G2_11043 [Hyphomicrobiales bacterium]CAH1670493.1 hypothetical protein CHELA1G11_13270 [Hyphomicrobiales bacterium]